MQQMLTVKGDLFLKYGRKCCRPLSFELHTAVIDTWNSCSEWGWQSDQQLRTCGLHRGTVLMNGSRHRDAVRRWAQKKPPLTLKQLNVTEGLMSCFPLRRVSPWTLCDMENGCEVTDQPLLCLRAALSLQATGWSLGFRGLIRPTAAGVRYITERIRL